jgi:hypothetical protein
MDKTNMSYINDNNQSVFSHLINQAIDECYVNLIQGVISNNPNMDIDYLQKNIFDYMKLNYDDNIKLLIIESYALLTKIKDSGITEDNYTSNEYKFDNALKTLEDLSSKKISFSMYPRPSKVTYCLKYFLYVFYDFDKELVKMILDVITHKIDVSNSRMPKVNKIFDKSIESIIELQQYKADYLCDNSKYDNIFKSIFQLKELHQFQHLIYTS